ncbi:hypothetical protein [Streptomyces sp. DSM 40750]|uniref:hypothetical protein n=1 Tax=Streptomyces sp. DSM 40750 TaxID=2801030 RepID=UPI00214CF45B|nr:hypothetical protein [Streptomyces sp. DSM 40750]UUU21505.1 hypothetical protein JIX55_14915 [Streptomyces sp. DSM 40750]
MPSATVRRAVTAGALTAALILPLSTQASADVGDEDIVRIKFTGVTRVDTSPKHIEPSQSWVTYYTLYTPKKKYAGDASSRCSAVEVAHHKVTTHCTRVLRLKKGEITLHDMITRDGKKPVTAKTAIVGGTGIYNDAEGEGYITLKDDLVHLDLYVDD